MTLLLFIIGLILLVVGAEALVRGASRIAAALGVSSLIIGLTVVAFGTSAPELAVSFMSALSGQSEIALGNVLGSNIFNVLFILGISALIAPLAVSQQLVRLDVPLMIGASVLTFILGADGKIGRQDGMLLFSAFVAYTVFLIRKGRKEKKATDKERAKKFRYEKKSAKELLPLNGALVLLGLGLLVVGSRWLVEGAVSIARTFGVSELVIGLTIVAAGTSLPEVATSVIASIRGERDIAVGNAVGSNIFNLMVVLGASGMFAPQGINVAGAALRFDVPIMITAAVACLPIFFTGHVIARWEGALFLGYYIAYALYVILAATRHASISAFGKAMMCFVIPLTVLTLAIFTFRSIRKKR
jgi:cation:H+ antiporter